jgi:hypothetical protein|tara:strand:- start:2168 stop:2872 length:705 start_codon:yes stop_codon:yes gene_type:complete
MKKAVISYNFGSYDKIPPIEWKTTDWDYLLFSDKTNSTEKMKGWDVVVLPEEFFESDNPKRRANQIKYTPFSTCLKELDKEYDLIVVIDANMVVQGDMDDFVDIHCMSTMDGVFLIHPNIEGAYEDIALCAKLEKDDLVSLKKTSNYFHEEGYPQTTKYFQTGVSIRRNTSAWKIIEYVFYEEYKKFSKRDQPMMNFVRWKYDVLDLNLIDIEHISDYLKYETHHFEQDALETP